jgi:hypothetical protein
MIERLLILSFPRLAQNALSPRCGAGRAARVAGLLGLFALCATAAAAESEDQRFLEGLRQRRLFSLAERFCQQRLADNALSDQQRAELVIEQIRTCATHAIHAPPQERDALWQQALAAGEQFRARYPEHPRLILVRVQEALTQLARGELLRQEAEVLADAGDAPERARTEIRQAAGKLEEIAEALTREIPLAGRTPRAGGLSAGELLSLQNNIYFHLARAYRNQALLYPADSDDRIGSLTRALGELDKARLQLPEGDALLWRLMLDQIVCQRLLGNQAKVRETLAALAAATSVPPDIALAARAEEARLALAAGQREAALEVLGRGRVQEGRTSAELDLALLEAYLDQWRAADEQKNNAAVEQWQQKAVAVVRLIEQEHGPYWGRRADLLLVRTAERGSGVADLEVMVRTADNFYLKKQYDEAIDAYDKAAQKALGAQNPARAFELFYKAAAVAHTLTRHADAASRLRKLALDFKTHPSAALAHRQAAWNESRQLAATGDAERLPAYVALLEEHLANWPTGEPADQVRKWLGDIRAHQRQWPEAIAAYLGVTPGSSDYAASVAAAARCGTLWLAELKAAGQPYDDRALDAAKYFEQLVYDDQGRPPATWDAVARLAAVTAARIRLQHTSGGHAEASALLEAALAASPEADAAWKADATSLLVVALAGQESRRGEAQQRLKDLADGDPRQLLEMLAGLAASADAAQPRAKTQMAALLLDAAKLLAPQRDKLDRTGQFTLARVEAEALAALGKRDEAQSRYEALARAYPDDARVQRGYAEFLLAAGDSATLSKALDQWRRVADRTPPRSEAWYQAKYSVALSLFKLGRKEEAATLIRYLQVTPPGLDGTSLKPRFLDLLALCGGK